MSNASDFEIMNGCLEKYNGTATEVTVPEGVTSVGFFAFANRHIEKLSLPASISDLPSRTSPGLEDLKCITISDDNPYYSSVDNALYSKDGSKLRFYPVGCDGMLKIPEGVKEIQDFALIGCKISAIHIPASLQAANSSCLLLTEVHEFSLAEGSPIFTCKDGILYDISGRTMLFYPVAKEDEVVIPDGVETVCLDSFCNAKNRTFKIHMGADMVPKIEWGELRENNSHITIYAPSGSAAERLARKSHCRFVGEGEPVTPDDSAERKTRSFQEWRNYYSFTNRAKGSHVTAFLRGSKIAYLPDNFGKPLIASIEKNAFLDDTAVICSKRIFAKLAEANKIATVKAFLLDSSPFSVEEKKYLTEYIKKNYAMLLQAFIADDQLDALKAILGVRKYADDAFSLALDAADGAGNPEIKAFFLNFKNEIAQK